MLGSALFLLGAIVLHRRHRISLAQRALRHEEAGPVRPVETFQLRVLIIGAGMCVLGGALIAGGIGWLLA